jgi:hypothetical protein
MSALPFRTSFRATVAALTLAAAAAAPAFAQEGLQLKRVLLSSGGVGYFEYQAQVSGTQDLELNLRLDQMDDVLKSLVVFDDKGGGGTVEMPSRAPLTEIFRSLPVGPDSFETTQTLLSALKGAEVTVDGPVSATGRILSVSEETATRDDTLVITRHRVSLMTREGIVQFVLEEAESIYFRDPTLNGQIGDALAALARHRERDGRTITITAKGEDTRTLTVAYVVETPLWKSSYRLTTQPGAENARMQGWAIVENASGFNWNDVELTLTSGNPVTFRQALYTAYYVNRPEIPVEVLGRILPNADDGAVDFADKGGEGMGRRASAPSDGAMAESAPMVMAAPPPPAPMSEMDDIVVTASRPIAAEASEAATQVIFVIPGTVSVGNGQSLAVPIIDRDVPGAAISLYQPQTHPRHPLAAVRLTNATETGMPPGVLTLYEKGASGTVYVGDARLNTLPAGETRLVAFALDQKATVDREDKYEQTVTKATLSRGILRMAVVDRRETIYTIKGAAQEPRKLVIEHPRDYGWTLVSPDPKDAEMTDSAFRLPVDVGAGETKTFSVRTEYPREETYRLVDMALSSIEANATNTSLSQAQRQVFERLREMRRDIDTAEAEMSTALSERERIFREQERIRENLKSVPERSDIAQRYLTQLNQQEDQLDALNARVKDAEERRDAARARLADYVGEIEL